MQFNEVTPKEDAQGILLTAAMRESFAQRRATDKQIAYIAALCKKFKFCAD